MIVQSSRYHELLDVGVFVENKTQVDTGTKTLLGASGADLSIKHQELCPQYSQYQYPSRISNQGPQAPAVNASVVSHTQCLYMPTCLQHQEYDSAEYQGECQNHVACHCNSCQRLNNCSVSCCDMPLSCRCGLLIVAMLACCGSCSPSTATGLHR